MENKSLDKQVGGKFYKSEFQPVELFAMLNLNAFQSNVTKYVSRYKKKNGIEDLKKAIHYCELAIELKPKTFVSKDINVYDVLDDFYKMNNLGLDERIIIRNVVENNFLLAKERLEMLMFKEY